MHEIEKHENLKQCAIYSYGKNQQLPQNSTCINNYVNPKSGFSASVIQSSDEIVIAYRGSEINTREDLGADIKMGMGKMPAQANDALAVFGKVRQQYPNAKIILTGHSLGGSLAQIVGAIHDVETVTFNAYGTKDLIKSNMTIYPDKITNYINLNDYEIITKNTHNQIGTCYSIGSKAGAANNHEAETMLPLEYRKKFDPKEYGKSQGKQAKEVHTGSAGCTGSYPVSSYTRSDGTKVGGYTRTCYVHGGNVLRGYSGKALKDMSADDINELLEDYL
jgi:hypothetical protein